MFVQCFCAQVWSEPRCDLTEFLHPNGTCVACPVCEPGEQLSEVTLVSFLSSFLLVEALNLHVFRTVALGMVATGCALVVKKARSARKQEWPPAGGAPSATC